MWHVPFCLALWSAPAAHRLTAQWTCALLGRVAYEVCILLRDALPQGCKDRAYPLVVAARRHCSAPDMMPRWPLAVRRRLSNTTCGNLVEIDPTRLTKHAYAGLPPEGMKSCLHRGQDFEPEIQEVIGRSQDVRDHGPKPLQGLAPRGLSTA